jgi:hypothetical protein
MAFKGVLPSDLWDRYDCKGGHQKLLLDLNVANDIQDRINEVTQKTKNKSGKDMVARRNQRREKRQLLSDSEGLDMLKGLGLVQTKE